MRRRLDVFYAVLFAAIGFAVSVADLWLFGLFGLDIRALSSHPSGWAILGGFCFGYAALGFVVGRLVAARARILAQMRALTESRASVAHHEKLAALGRLAAGIAHEVRNPLGVIRASASMIEEGLEQDSEDRRACVFIREEIDRLDGLIGALLAFARPQKMNVDSVDLASSIDRAARLLAEAQRDGVRVVARIDAAEKTVHGDADLLTQLFFGLFVNAAEAGAGLVEVRMRSAEDAIAIEVADDGPGIAENDRDRVLEPFYTTKPHGTGLGLAMAARIVEAHGGVIEADGRGARPDGGGACFAIQLPIAGPSAREAA